MGAVSAVTGIAQLVGASNTEIDERKEYKPTTQMLRSERMAEKRAKEGLSAGERELYKQGQAARAAGAERSMRNQGLGQFASSISAMYDVQGSNQLAALNAQEKRRGEQQYASLAQQFQTVADRETASFNQMVNQQEQALGQAYSSAVGNITGGLGTVAGGLGSLGGGASPEGTTSGVNASGEAISMSPNYDPSTDAMSGGFQSDFGGNTPAGTMTGEGLGTSALDADFSGFDTPSVDSVDPSLLSSPFMGESQFGVRPPAAPIGQPQTPGQVNNMGYNDPNNPNNPNFIEGGEVLPNSMFGIG
tara:strand:- start:1138 stop:2049 length:912 start_codon:yes stop_codon:yes gene_type:complete